MEKNDLVYKVKVKVEGEEIPNILVVGEHNDEEGVVEVPGFRKKIKIKDGVRVIPEIPMTLKITRDGTGRRFFADWKNRNQYKNVVLEYVDASGNRIDSEFCPNCEVSMVGRPEVNHESVSYASFSVTLLPEDVTPVD